VIEDSHDWTFYIDGKPVDGFESAELTFDPVPQGCVMVNRSAPGITFTVRQNLDEGMWYWWARATRRRLHAQRYRLLSHKRIHTAQRFFTE
jgi:hypothetical protein